MSREVLIRYTCTVRDCAGAVDGKPATAERWVDVEPNGHIDDCYPSGWLGPDRQDDDTMCAECTDRMCNRGRFAPDGPGVTRKG